MLSVSAVCPPPVHGKLSVSSLPSACQSPCRLSQPSAGPPLVHGQLSVSSLPSACQSPCRLSQPSARRPSTASCPCRPSRPPVNHCVVCLSRPPARRPSTASCRYRRCRRWTARTPHRRPVAPSRTSWTRGVAARPATASSSRDAGRLEADGTAAVSRSCGRQMEQPR